MCCDLDVSYVTSTPRPLWQTSRVLFVCSPLPVCRRLLGQTLSPVCNAEGISSHKFFPICLYTPNFQLFLKTSHHCPVYSPTVTTFSLQSPHRSRNISLQKKKKKKNQLHHVLMWWSGTPAWSSRKGRVNPSLKTHVANDFLSSRMRLSVSGRNVTLSEIDGGHLYVADTSRISGGCTSSAIGGAEAAATRRRYPTGPGGEEGLPLHRSIPLNSSTTSAAWR